MTTTVPQREVAYLMLCGAVLHFNGYGRSKLGNPRCCYLDFNGREYTIPYKLFEALYRKGIINEFDEVAGDECHFMYELTDIGKEIASK